MKTKFEVGNLEIGEGGGVDSDGGNRLLALSNILECTQKKRRKENVWRRFRENGFQIHNKYPYEK